jgi:uncharacterized protein (DUF3084 family)
MPNVEVISPKEVHIDGTNFGNVADAIANNAEFVPDIQRALELYDANLITAHQTAIDAVNAAKTQAISERDAATTELTAANLARDRAKANLTTMTEQRNALQTQLADLQTEKQALAQALAQELTDVRNELTVSQAALAQNLSIMKRILADEQVSERERLYLINTTIVEAEKPAKQRELEAFRKQRDDIQAKIDVLEAPHVEHHND